MESESIFQAGGNTLNCKWENSYLLRGGGWGGEVKEFAILGNEQQSGQ